MADLSVLDSAISFFLFPCRYNAEKTKVGMYYSTPVYQFRMKCHLCDNHIEMKTDPGVCFIYDFSFVKW